MAGEEKQGREGLGTPAWVALVVAALVAGVLAGHFLLGGAAGGTVSLGGKTRLSAGELDSTIATYTYEGQVHDITARAVIEQAQSVEAAADEDGTYAVPGATDVVSFAQNEILLAEAAKKGLSVTDEETAAFAAQMFGTDDFATIGSSYGIDAETAKSTLADSALVGKLRDSVVTTQVPEQPAKPVEPAEGEEDAATADYASYVIALLGDEWDGEADDWARTDGDYYATLSGYEISGDAATYAAAQAAYNVAASKYQAASQQALSEFNAYAASLLSRATIQIGSLAA